MSEVELRKAEQLGTLAERINEEHRACEEAATEALRHAIEAGRLLQQVKASLPHGDWLAWLQANFEGSERTAQGYVRLHKLQGELAAQNRNGVAHFTLRGALKALATAKKPTPPALWLPQAPEGVQPDPAVLKGWEEDQAAIAASARRSQEALALQRVAERADELRGIIVALDGLTHSYSPEEAGAALAQMAGNGRAVAALREGIGWLAQVAEEAEAAQGRMQDAE